MRRLGLVLALVSAACSPLELPRPAQVTPTTHVAPPPFEHDLDVRPARLHIRYPASWSGAATTEWSGAERRLAVLANRSLAASPDVARDGIRLELRTQLDSYQVSQSAFPLDWDWAERLPDESELTVWRLPVTHLGTRMMLIARVGPDASAQDRSALRSMVASVTASPLPATGIFDDPPWLAASPLSAFPAGSVTALGLPYAPELYISRGAFHTLATTLDSSLINDRSDRSYCRARWDAASSNFVCDADGERWSRFGTPLRVGQPRTLRMLAVHVQAGIVYISLAGAASFVWNEELEGAALPPQDRFRELIARSRAGPYQVTYASRETAGATSVTTVRDGQVRDGSVAYLAYLLRDGRYQCARVGLPYACHVATDRSSTTFLNPAVEIEERLRIDPDWYAAFPLPGREVLRRQTECFDVRENRPSATQRTTICYDALGIPLYVRRVSGSSVFTSEAIAVSTEADEGIFVLPSQPQR